MDQKLVGIIQEIIQIINSFFFQNLHFGIKIIELSKGGPVFHDALKGWSCCKKRVTDFGEFLAMPGCTAGPHSEQD